MNDDVIETVGDLVDYLNKCERDTPIYIGDDEKNHLYHFWISLQKGFRDEEGTMIWESPNPMADIICQDILVLSP
jgi:hypothetical protein